MSLRAQVTLIHSIAVPSTWKKYDADNVPAQLSQAKLPALVLVETANQTGEFTEMTYGGGQFDATYFVSHILVWKPTVSGRINKIIALGEMIDFLDTYLTAAKVLIPQFDVPPRVSVKRLPSIVEGEAEYYAREFVWRLEDYL